jgi:outer membrane protein assembly factor BamB
VLRVRDPATLGTLWSYTNANASAISALYYHYSPGRVFYGDAVGKMYAIVRNGSTSGGQVLSSNYPYQPAGTTTASDSILVAPVYVDGVAAYGTSTGKVIFIDAQNASNQPAVIQMYHFGSAVSSIAYEYVSSSVGNFMIGTANGRVHLIRRDTGDATTMRDPTSGNP